MSILTILLIYKGLFVFGLYIAFTYYYNYAHELTHARVYENNNIKYKMKVGLGQSYCDGESETPETIRDHNLIEAIGYHLRVFLDFLFGVFAICFMYYN